MSKSPRKPKVVKIKTAEQRRAIASPLRVEMLGLFTSGGPLSVAQIAERMGRPATAIYYHVRVMEKAGLLRREGTRREGRRPETLYVPTGDLFQLEQPKGPSASRDDSGLKTLSAAFRMAERDMRAALEDPDVRGDGPHRNVFGARLHCRLSRKELAELNRLLRGIEKMLMRSHKDQKLSEDDSFVSLTVALAPLRDREVRK